MTIEGMRFDIKKRLEDERQRKMDGKFYHDNWTSDLMLNAIREIERLEAELESLYLQIGET